MSKEQMTEYRRKLGEFFYPFLANVELGNISAVENTKNLIDAFIAYSEVNMGFNELPNFVQQEACKTLKEAMVILLINEDEPAKNLARAIKSAFEALFIPQPNNNRESDLISLLSIMKSDSNLTVSEAVRVHESMVSSDKHHAHMEIVSKVISDFAQKHDAKAP